MPSEAISSLRGDIALVSGAKQQAEEKIRQLARRMDYARQTNDKEWLDQTQAEFSTVAEDLQKIANENSRLERQLMNDKALRNKEIASELKSGDLFYDVEQGAVTGISPQTQYKKRRPDADALLRDRLAEYADVDPKRISTNFELQPAEKAFLASAPNTQSKVRFLRDLFEDAIPLEIENKENFLVKTPEGSYFLANNPNLTASDIGALAYQAPIEGGVAAAGMVAGAYGAASGLAGMMLAGNSTFATGGFGRDVLWKAMAGQTEGEGAVGETMKEAGQTAAATMGTGLVLDAAIGGAASKLLGKRMGAQVENEVVKEFSRARKTLEAGGFQDVPNLQQAQKGFEGILAGREVATSKPNSALGIKHSRVHDMLGQFQDAWTSGKPINVQQQRAMAQTLQAQEEAALAEVAKQGKRLNEAQLGMFQNRQRALAQVGYEKEQAGAFQRQILEQAEQQASTQKNAQMEAFFQTADQNGVAVSPEKMLQNLWEAKKNGGFGDNPQIDSVLSKLANAKTDAAKAQALRAQAAQLTQAGQQVPYDMERAIFDLEQYSQPFNAERSRALIRDLQGMVPANMVGSSNKDYISASVAKAARDTLEQELTAKGMAGEWAKARSAYENFLNFDSGVTERVLGTPRNGAAMANTDVVEAMLKNEATVGEVLTHTRKNLGPQQAAALQQSLQSSYLSKIGAGGDTQLKYKPEVVRALWGQAADGSPTPHTAQRMMQSMDEVNQAYKLAKVSMENKTPQEINDLLKPMSQQERKAVVNASIAKAKADEGAKRVVNNAVLSLVKDGSGKYNPLNIPKMASALLDGDNAYVKQAMASMSPMEQQLMRASVRAEVMGRLSVTGSTAETRNKMQLWNGEKLMKMAQGWERGKANQPEFFRNLDTVLGPKQTDTLLAASKYNFATAPLRPGQDTHVNVSLANQGPVLSVRGLLGSGERSILGLLWGQDKLEPLVRLIYRDVGTAAEERNRRIIQQAVMGSRTAMITSAHLASQDADFAQWVNDSMRGLKISTTDPRKAPAPTMRTFPDAARSRSEMAPGSSDAARRGMMNTSGAASNIDSMLGIPWPSGGMAHPVR